MPTFRLRPSAPDEMRVGYGSFRRTLKRAEGDFTVSEEDAVPLRSDVLAEYVEELAEPEAAEAEEQSDEPGNLPPAMNKDAPPAEQGAVPVSGTAVQRPRAPRIAKAE